MLFFLASGNFKKKKRGGGGAQADQRLLSSAKHWYVLGEAESHLWLSTLYHDDSAPVIMQKRMPPLKKILLLGERRKRCVM